VFCLLQKCIKKAFDNRSFPDLTGSQQDSQDPNWIRGGPQKTK